MNLDKHFFNSVSNIKGTFKCYSEKLLERYSDPKEVQVTLVRQSKS